MSLELDKIKTEISKLALELKKRKLSSDSQASSRHSDADDGHFVPAPPILPLSLPSLAPEYPNFENTVHYKELKQFEDRMFIGAAYLALLGHVPDPQGEAEYLLRLRNGSSKAEILIRLRYSAEGKIRAVRLRGIFFPAFFAFLEMLPLLGAFFRYVQGLFFFPAKLQKLQKEHALLFEHLQESNKLIEERLNACILHLNRLRFLQGSTRQENEKVSLLDSKP